MKHIKILSGGAANGLVNALRERFKQDSGYGIEGDFGAVGAMFDRVVALEQVDIIILSQKLMDELGRQGLLAAHSMRALGRVVTGLCVREGTPAPTLGDAESLKAALLKADAIYLPDYVKSTAGIHFAGVLRKLGVFEQLASRLKAFANGQTAMAAMARGDDACAIGCTQITEILNTPGVRYVADLPEGLDLTTVYTAAMASRSHHPQAAQQLLDLLSAPQNAQVRQRAGFLP